MAQQYKELSDKVHKSEARLNSLNLELRRSEEERNGCVAELKSKDAQLNVIWIPIFFRAKPSNALHLGQFVVREFKKSDCQKRRLWREGSRKFSAFAVFRACFIL